MRRRLPFAALTLLTILPSPAMADEHYLCHDNVRLTATFNTPKEGAGSVEIVFAGSNERIVLPQVLSADGGRYAAGGTEFWIKGKQATLTQGGKVTTCKL
jgi:membrane-bound inhibitor of C-type lysozyme